MKDFPIGHEKDKKRLYYPSIPSEGDVLEIGPGRGDLILTLAPLNPSTKFIAIELGLKRFHKLAARLEKKAIQNVTLIQADARVALPEDLPQTRFSTIYVLFPDPWPKKRHAFRRLLQPAFIEFLTTFLKPQGRLICATDDQPYAELIHQGLQAHEQLTNDLAPAPCLPDLDELPETYFKMKWLGEGRELFFFKYSKC